MVLSNKRKSFLLFDGNTMLEIISYYIIIAIVKQPFTKDNPYI